MRLLSSTGVQLCSALLLVLSLAACQQVQPPSQRLPPLPQDPLVQVYFNHAASSEYTEPYRHRTRPGDNLEQKIVEAIAGAKFTVDVAVQELRLPQIAQALVERQQAGVKVRVILENTYSRPGSTLTAAEVTQLPPRERDRYNEFRQLVDINQDKQLDAAEIGQRDALVILDRGRIHRIDDTADGSAGSGLMHHKFVIVDNRTLIVTSANFTSSDIHGDFTNPNSTGNANNLLQIDSPELSALFTNEFNLLWGDGPGGKLDSKFGLAKPWRAAYQIQLGSSAIAVRFSPTSPTLPWSQSSNGLIGKTLNSATQSVDLALFVFSDQQLANILERNYQHSVQVRALIEPEFAYRSYSEVLDLLGVSLSNNCQVELQNHPWQQAIATVGTPQLAKGDLLHHKFGIVDKQTVITGSHNWSDAANKSNDEALLVIHNPTIAAHYEREFDRLYTNAQLGIPDKLQKKIQLERQKCSQVKQAESFTASPAQSTSELASQRVNLNTASLEELESLPGVGAKLAQRMIQARQQQPFTSLQDLDRVPGVGPNLLERLSDRVTW